MRPSRIVLDTRRMVAVVGLLAGAVSAAVLAGVFAGPPETGSDRAQRPKVGESPAPKAEVVRAFSGLAILPNEGLQDWVSYTDYVGSASVIDERRGGLSSEEVETGEGLAIRMVRLKVDAVIWSAESAGQTPAGAAAGSRRRLVSQE